MKLYGVNAGGCGERAAQDGSGAAGELQSATAHGSGRGDAAPHGAVARPERALALAERDDAAAGRAGARRR